MQYEYKYIEEKSNSALVETANKLGAEGWHLVNMWHTGSFAAAIFGREVVAVEAETADPVEENSIRRMYQSKPDEESAE